MRIPRLLALLAVLLLVAAPPPPAAAGPEGPAADAPRAITLRSRPSRRFDLVLPEPTLRRVSGPLVIEAVGATFATAVEGRRLRLDTDGDGETDVTLEGDDGYAVLEGTEGRRYGARFVRRPSGWHLAPSGSMVGTIDGVRVRLVDQDADGRYDGVGRDAIVVGHGDAAAYLSRVIAVDGRLLEIAPRADGTALEVSPYEGPAGRLDLVTGLETDGRLLAAVVRRIDGAMSFELASAPEGQPMPAGRYELVQATVGLGESRVHARGDAERPFVVEADATTTPAWGGPLEAELEVRRRPGEIGLDPALLRYRGRAGETWHGWSPFGKSPEFRLVDAATRDEIAKAIFTGC